MGLRWYAVSSLAQLDEIRDNHRDDTYNVGLLSYGAQVKIKDIDVDQNNYSHYNMYGISFRIDDTNGEGANDDINNMYAISFVKLIKPTEANILNQAPAWYKNYIHPDPDPADATVNSPWEVFSTGNGLGKWFVVLWKRVYNSSSSNWEYSPLAYYKISNTDGICRAGANGYCDKLDYWGTLMVYADEVAVGANVSTNHIWGYLAQPEDYIRRTTENQADILWPITDGEPNNLTPSIFKPIEWTIITGSGASLYGGNYIIEDDSLTTANYEDYTIGNYAQTKAREIGLHIFNMSTSAQNIFFDNFYIDLSQSTGSAGYVDGSGQVVVGP